MKYTEKKRVYAHKTAQELDLIRKHSRICYDNNWSGMQLAGEVNIPSMAHPDVRQMFRYPESAKKKAKRESEIIILLQQRM